MPNRAYVILRLSGGLGNQMFQYALGLAMTADGRRRLVVDRSQIDHDALRAYALDVFRHEPARLPWGLRSAAIAVLSRTRIWLRQGQTWGRLYPGGPRVIRERTGRFDPDVLKADGHVLLDGYWQSEAYFASHRRIIEQAMTWRDEPDERERTYLAKIGDAESVAVHVRRGDYVSNPATRQYHGVCDAAYYTQAAAMMAKKLSKPRFFVVSDDPDWAQANLTWPGPAEVVRLNQPDRPHRDMRVMSRCRHAIIANSSFSWWGAWLTEQPGKIVIAPQRWFNQTGEHLADPVPARWIRM
ncbi:MAG: alpha-1,2-fucosyltransferase [Phycisphaeraceae bacterium]|nr:alpha-1,2-fucosyltransferase [Phycisphaeraceae bacterium]